MWTGLLSSEGYHGQGQDRQQTSASCGRALTHGKVGCVWAASLGTECRLMKGSWTAAEDPDLDMRVHSEDPGEE